MITKIVSGAQTGADRAGLDVAIRHGFPHGGNVLLEQGTSMLRGPDEG